MRAFLPDDRDDGGISIPHVDDQLAKKKWKKVKKEERRASATSGTHPQQEPSTSEMANRLKKLMGEPMAKKGMSECSYPPGVGFVQGPLAARPAEREGREVAPKPLNHVGVSPSPSCSSSSIRSSSSSSSSEGEDPV